MNNSSTFASKSWMLRDKFRLRCVAVTLCGQLHSVVCDFYMASALLLSPTSPQSFRRTITVPDSPSDLSDCEASDGQQSVEPSPTSFIDLTREGAQAMRLPSARHPGAFTMATRRVYSRRERAYERPYNSSPQIVIERLDTVCDEPASLNDNSPAEHPARTRALNHLASAYAITAYSHAALSVALVAIGIVGLLAFALALTGDVSRKTRERAAKFSSSAAECARNLKQNNCFPETPGNNAMVASTPALEQLCREWMICAAQADFAWRDALSGTVWAETLAETINAFSNKMSSVTMVVAFALAMVFAFSLSTAAFSYMHRKLTDCSANSPLKSPEKKSNHECRPSASVRYFSHPTSDTVSPKTPRPLRMTPSRALPPALTDPQARYRPHIYSSPLTQTRKKLVL